MKTWVIKANGAEPQRYFCCCSERTINYSRNIPCDEVYDLLNGDARALRTNFMELQIWFWDSNAIISKRITFMDGGI